MTELEVVIPIQDKDPDLLSNCLQSIQKANRNEVVVYIVDLSSSQSDLYRSMAKDYGIKYTYLPYSEWNKPVALNYALKRTNSKWFGCLDGDYLIEKEFFEKIVDKIEEESFLQCRGYEMKEKYSRLYETYDKNDHKENDEEYNLSFNELTDHLSFANAITNYNMDSRPFTDYGGFQAFPTEVGREINGYDERFRLYGGEHNEMRNRLRNKGLKEKRLHGDPILIHQTHQSWVESGEYYKTEIKEERERHLEIIKELEQGNRVKANTQREWGEV